MTTLTGYSINEVILESKGFVTYRGVRDADRMPVTIKRFLSGNRLHASPKRQESVQLRQEYALGHSISDERILHPIGIEELPEGPVLIQEDFGGMPLKLWLTGRALPLSSFLQVAIQVVDALTVLHRRRIIHKNITPAGIFINAATGHVKLGGLGIASQMMTENQGLANLHALEGDLTYMSPEQTGRMNRLVDYRTDFYSLGVTFYEMLTGAPPFEAADPLELVHSHIARQPVPPNVIRPEIPEVVSEIVLKLMSKTAEDRYKSASGLKTDLERCRASLEDTGDIEWFEPGFRDVPDRFQIPQKLYGREDEIEALLAAFDRVSEGASELMLVYGYSGIGKSTLVNEVQRPIVRTRGYFVSGKFDQFKRDLPYASLIQAFQGLVRQLLTESEENLADWKVQLLEALGSVGQVIIDVIPEMEWIVGPQPAVPQLGPAEAQNRFRLVFQRLIRVFARPGHPLVVFLDDLQWADSASLDLLQALVTDSNSRHLLMIGAYRDNEVNAAHPLTLTLEKIEQSPAIVHRIALGPLNLSHLTELVSDTLYCTPSQALPLAELVLSKTLGNPYFVIEFLKTLYDKQLLVFREGTEVEALPGWRWDLDQIERAQITDNVVELMVSRIRQFDEATLEGLMLGASIGNTFDVEILALLQDISLTDATAALWPAMVEGLVRPLDDAYKLVHAHDGIVDVALGEEASSSPVRFTFEHDRVQQAVYSLIPEDDQAATHLQIGRLMLRHTDESALENEPFEVVNHLNQGGSLIEEPAERRRLAELNLLAGKKAKTATAFQPALHYLRAGAALLNADSWESDYALSFALGIERAECEYLTTHFEESEQLFDSILTHARTTLDKLAVYRTKVRLLYYVGKEIESIEAGLEGLKLLGFHFAMHPGKLDLIRSLLKVMATQGRKDVADLIDLPDKMTPEIRAAMDILMNLWGVTFWINQDLNGLLVLKMVELSLKYGNADASSVAYVCFGVLQNVLGKVKKGTQYGALAVALAEKFDNPFLSSKVTFISTSFFAHYARPLKEVIPLFRQGLKQSLESGEFIYAGYCANMIMFLMSPAGFPLDVVREEAKRLIDSSRHIENMQSVVTIQVIERWAALLKGDLEASPSISGGNPEFAVDIFNSEEGRYEMELGTYWLWEMQLLFLFGRHEEALEFARRLKGNTITEPTWAYLPSVYHMYYALIAASLYPDATDGEKKGYKKILKKSLQMLKKYASLHAGNFEHKYFLVQAEWARLEGKHAEAERAYDQAAASAAEHGFLQNAAIARERAGLFYLERGRDRIARVYLDEASLAYTQWGASAKVEAMQATLGSALSAKSSAKEGEAPLARERTEALDLRTVLKASQAISGELVLDQLLVKLMQNVVENAGAERGLLILDEDGEWIIEAESSVNTPDVDVKTFRLAESGRLSHSIVNYVARTKEPVVLNDAAKEGLFTSDAHIIQNSPRSILCAPLINQGKLIGMLYLENNLTSGAFTPGRLELLHLLSSEIAISIENARLYNNMEAKVEARTEELKSKNEALESALKHLKMTQTQLIQAEKMASLGELTAGIAHEIKNPLNFINNFAQLNIEIVQEMREDLNSSKGKSTSELAEGLREAMESLELNASKITEHGQRADRIVRSMMEHASGSPGVHEPTDLNMLVRESLDLAYHGMRAQHAGFNVTLDQSYETELSLVSVRRQELSRVFINMLNNAFYAVMQKERAGIPDYTPTVSVRTSLKGEILEIQIEDNGTGIPAAIRQKIFEPFFTTKPAGSGTGLGLSLSYDIIVQGHGGELTVESEEGEYTRFIIRLPAS